MNKLMGVCRRISRYFFACLFILLGLGWPSASSAQSLDSDKANRAIQDLSQKMLAVAGDHAVIRLEVRNLSTLSVSDAEAVGRALEENLRSRGARITAELPADAEIRLTLSENLQDYLWVAEIHHGDSRDSRMILVPRTSEAAHSQASPELTLRKEFLFQQQSPILDLIELIPAEYGSPSSNRILVLEPAQAAIVRVDALSQKSQTQSLEAAISIEHAQPWPRDLRGRLRMDGRQFKVFLPGTECGGSIQPALTLTCQPSTNPWALPAGQGPPKLARFAASRNYFEGIPMAAARDNETGTAALFYSWAFQPGDAASGIFAELNGETRVVQGDRGSIATIPGLGSDLVTLTSDCGSGWQLLATKPGDWTVSDSVRAYQILNNQALPVGREVDFDGPVTALWPAEGGKTVHTVVHNLKSRFYEVYSLSITCGR